MNLNLYWIIIIKLINFNIVQCTMNILQIIVNIDEKTENCRLVYIREIKFLV